ncbi:MAG: hypothetical protein ACLFUF_02405 [Opitutales bacterium]
MFIFYKVNTVNTEARKINVTAIHAAFKTARLKRKITPLRFCLANGEQHEIAEIRRSYTDRVGASTYVHFVVRSRDDRYFDIVYDSREMDWRLVLEIEDSMILR